jgi:hypothetical protein
MTQKGKGPRENSSSGTAPDQNAYSDASVVTDDTESVVALEHNGVVELVDGMESEDANLISDSGWSIQNRARVRVRWHGVPNHGSFWPWLGAPRRWTSVREAMGPPC